MTFDEITDQIEARPTPTPEQYADARRYLLKNAHDLIAVIFGDDTQGELTWPATPSSP